MSSKPPPLFPRTQSDRTFASHKSTSTASSAQASSVQGSLGPTRTGSTSSSPPSNSLHVRTGSLTDFVIKFSEVTQDLTVCNSTDHHHHLGIFQEKKVQSASAGPASAWATGCMEGFEVEENDCLRTAYELYRV